MHNANADRMVTDCNSEMTRIEHLIEGFGSTNAVSGFLTRYALMKMSSTLECAYKAIIADYYKAFSSELERFIDVHVTDANMNACYDNISKMLRKFDDEKNNIFKEKARELSDYNRCCSSFSELNTIRNNVVHGGTTLPSFLDLRSKFDDSIKIIEKLDEVMV